ncbi:hypothetical protein FG386_002743 [Cryptosporidium ryanae]|uniref:uncharacterized protein n=1 Tax=Cryptosporidium ryanae TaxID=515981 RepID=UPI00351A7CE6|nr:hypothetical protein FG386_002743 [Cryptosporidium ryanae]
MEEVCELQKDEVCFIEHNKTTPDLQVFSNDIDQGNMSQKINGYIQNLCEHSYVLNVKIYRNIWKEFFAKAGKWMGNNGNIDLFRNTISTLSCSNNSQVAKIWLISGLLMSNKGNVDKMIDSIYVLFKNNVICEYIKLNNIIVESEYLYFLRVVSDFINTFMASKWKDWIYSDLSSFLDVQKFDNYQKFILDISIYYVNNNNDETLKKDIIKVLCQLISPILCCGSELTLRNIIKTFSSDQVILNSFINSILRQLKRTTKPINVLVLLEFFINEINKNGNVNSKLDSKSIDIINALVDHVSNSVLTIISPNSEQNQENIKIIRTSLNICYFLIFGDVEKENGLFSLLEETILSINVSKTTVQMKISLLLLVNTILMKLLNLKINKYSSIKCDDCNSEFVNNNDFFRDNFSKKSQEALLSTMDIKIPIASPQYSDHFKLLSVHTNSLVFALNNSLNSNYSDKYLKKIQLIISDSSMNDTSKLIVLSSFINALHLIKIINCFIPDGSAKITSLSKEVVEILFSKDISNLISSALNKTNSLKKLSIGVLGQILSIKDILSESDVFNRLNIASNIKNSSLLFPKLNTLLGGSFSFFPNNHRNAEINAFLVIMEVISNPKYKGSTCSDYLPTLNLSACMQLFKDRFIMQSVENYIALLIQTSRILSFLPLSGDFNLKIVQYSAANIEIFQGITLISCFKKPPPRRDGVITGGDSLIDYVRNNQVFKDEAVLYNLIVSFSIVLGFFYSINISNAEKSSYRSEVSDLITLRNVDLRKSWTLILSIAKNHVCNGNGMKCQYLVLFLLCSYHPLIQKNVVKEKHGKLLENKISDVSGLFDLTKMLNSNEFRDNLVQFYVDLTYLPLSDTTGFRKSCLNMLCDKYIMKDAQFLRELTDKLCDNYCSSLEFLTTNMPVELGDFVISDPSNPYEFDITNFSNTDYTENFQESIYKKVTSFMAGDKNFGDFSEIYELIKTSRWIENSIMSSFYQNSSVVASKSGASGLSLSQSSAVLAEKSKNKDVSSVSSNNAPANINTTSAFAIAKLRKAQIECKSKSGKQSSNKVFNTTETSSSLSAGTSGGNMTKKEIVDQQIKKQNNIRRDIFKIISRIKCVLEIFVGISENASSFVSLKSSGLIKNNDLSSELETKLSDIVFKACSKMIEFKPLKFYTIELMRRILNNNMTRNKRFEKCFLEYLSIDIDKGNENERRKLLKGILESFKIKTDDLDIKSKQNMILSDDNVNCLGDSYSLSALICIVSKALYSLCENNKEDELVYTTVNEDIQILSKLILYISLCIKNNNVQVQVRYICNLLHLYMFLLGDLVLLDQYTTPIKLILMDIKIKTTQELELVSSLLIFPYLSIRLLILELMVSETSKNNLVISYFSYLNIKISSQVNSLVDETTKMSDKELNRIVCASSELSNKYLSENTSDHSLKRRFIEDLLIIQTSPAITSKQQRNISKVILNECIGDKVTSETCNVINVLLDKLESVKKEWLDSEKLILASACSSSQLLYENNWPIFLCRPLINGMVPRTVGYLDSVIPSRIEDLNAEERRMVFRMQKRNSVKGLLMCLKELIREVDDGNYESIEFCVRFILINVIDSTILKDAGTDELNFERKDKRENDKKVVKNASVNKKNYSIKNRVFECEKESLGSLEGELVDFFVAMSNNKYIHNSASKILETLKNLSTNYKPEVNSEQFYNTLAFSIGCIASCCSIDDPIVKEVTYKIVDELLNGKLCKKTSDNLPLLTDIPNEYTKILPKLFGMLYSHKGSSGVGSQYSFRTSSLDDLQDVYSDYVLSESKDGCFSIEKSLLKGKESGESDEKWGDVLLGYRILEISLSSALFSEEPGKRIGSAHVFGSVSNVIGVRKMSSGMIFKLMSDILSDYSDGSTKNKLPSTRVEGVLNCIGSLSMYLGILIEPHVVKYLNNIIKIISENDQRIRHYSEKTTEILVKNLSKYGIKQILPLVVDGIEEKQWRIKIAILRLLVILSNNSPSCLSFFLPKAIEIINKTASDSHQNVSKAAKETLYQIIELVKNPEVRNISEEFVETLIDPTENNIRRSLLTLKSITFIHAVDTTTLSLILPVLLKPVQERGQTELKKDSLQILSSLLLLLSQRSDIDPFIKQIEDSIHISLTDPIPEIRILTAKLCRSLVSVIGQEKSSSLIEWHFNTLSLEVGQTLKSGVSASLAEILSVLGIEKFKKILPYILSQVCLADHDSTEQAVGLQTQSSSSSIKEGYVGLFVYLPQTFGEELGYLMPEILPKLLYCLGDESDLVREMALKACKSLVLQFGSGYAGYIMQPLEDGLTNNNWRVRLSCCTLLGVLLNRLIKGQLDSTGTSLCNDTKVLEEAGFSLQRRSYILAAIYMARSDENVSVKNSASALWKSLVQNTPQTLKDILPILIRRIINSLSGSESACHNISNVATGSSLAPATSETNNFNGDDAFDKNKSNMHYIAVQCLKELLDKFGNSLQSQLLPIFYQNMGGVYQEDIHCVLGKSCETDAGLIYANPSASARLGACIGLLELLRAIRKNDLKSSINSFMPLVKMGLSDSEFKVRSVSVECLDIISAENPDSLFETIDWLLDDVLPFEGDEEHLSHSKISAIELIIQLPHSGIIAKIFPRVSYGSVSLNKIRIVKSMSKIPSQSKLRSSLFDIVPLLLNAYSVLSGTQEIRESAYDAMNEIVQSLDEQGVETYVTILLDIIKNNTPHENLTISGRHIINNLGISSLSQLEKSENLVKRVRSLDFLRLSLFSNSPIYETSYQTLIKYIIPIAICDISEEARMSASVTFQKFVSYVPRKLVVKSSSVTREAIGKLVYDPADHQKHFDSEESKLIGNITWEVDSKTAEVSNCLIFSGKDYQCYISSKTSCDKRRIGDEKLLGLIDSNNKLLDSITSLYIQGITLGTVDSKEECALGLYEVISMSLRESIKPITVKLVGPLIRLISDKATTTVVRVSLLNNLSLFIELCGQQLRPLLPQIQTILIKYIVDTNSNIRKSCISGIGNLYKLLGNRSETLLSDLCSLVAKQTAVAGSFDVIYSILNSIYEAIKPCNGQMMENDSLCNKDAHARPTQTSMSSSLRDRIIGMTLSFIDDSNEYSTKDLSDITSKVLSYILTKHCADDEIREILLPMVKNNIFSEFSRTNCYDLDLHVSSSRSLMKIIGCSLETVCGWQRICRALRDDEGFPSKMVCDQILDCGFRHLGSVESARTTGDGVLSSVCEDTVAIGVGLPSETRNKGLSWLYLTVANSVLGSLLSSSESSNAETKRFFVDILYKMCKYTTQATNRDDSEFELVHGTDVTEFSASIIIQVLLNITLNSSLLYNRILTSSSDISVILALQKLCELLVESCFVTQLKNAEVSLEEAACGSELLPFVLKEIEKNSGSYSNSTALADLSPISVFISLITVTSIQTLNSKHTILKLKSEQILINVIKFVYHLLYNSNRDLEGFNIAQGRTDEHFSDQDLLEKRSLDIVSCIVQNTNKLIHPKEISISLSNYLIEYSKRVLVRKLSSS